MSDMANKLRRLAELRLKEDMLEWSGEADLLCEAADRIAALERQLAELRAQPTAQQVESARDAELQQLRKISWLIGSIFVHGDFKAETFNERELEKLLRAQGTFWDSLEEFDAALQAGKEPKE